MWNLCRVTYLVGEAVLRDTVRTRTNAQSHKTPLRRASRRRSHSHDGRNNSAPAERVHPAFSAIAWQLEHSQTVLGAAELKDALRRLEPGLRGPRCLLGLLAGGLEGPGGVSNAGGVWRSVCPLSTVRACDLGPGGCAFVRRACVGFIVLATEPPPPAASLLPWLYLGCITFNCGLVL